MIVLNKFKLSILAASLTLCLGQISHAAIIPADIELEKKQTIVRGNNTEIQSLDPHKVDGVPERNVLNDLLEPLAIPDPYGKLTPAGATHWETQDNQTWRFFLRKDAKWSNGDPVTAHDYVYAWQRISDPATASPHISYLQFAHINNIDEIIKGELPKEQLGVKALDEHTLEVTLSTPVAYFPDMLYHFALLPLHQKTIEKYGDEWTRPGNFVGNAAFTLKDWVVNEKIILEKNPTYWDSANTVITEVTFLPVAEINELQRYRSGEIDMTSSVPIELFQKMKKELPNELKVGPFLCSYFFEPNHQKAPFNDIRVRDALKLGLDQTTMTEKVLAQGQKAAFSYTPIDINGVTLTPYPWFELSQNERNEEGRRLLKEAGFDEKNPLTFKLLYNTSDVHQKLAIAAAQMWKKNLGVEVELVNQEWKTFLDTRHNGNFDVSRAGWCGAYNEASTFLNRLRSDSSSNTAFYKNEHFDELLDKAVRENNELERDKLYKAAQDLLDTDSAVIPLYQYVKVKMVKPYVGGYTNEEPLDYIYTKDLYIKKID